MWGYSRRELREKGKFHGFGRLMPFVSLGFCSIFSIAIVIFRAFSSGVGTIEYFLVSSLSLLLCVLLLGPSTTKRCS